jgi:hypothetical protein
VSGRVGSCGARHLKRTGVADERLAHGRRAKEPERNGLGEPRGCKRAVHAVVDARAARAEGMGTVI